MKHIHVAGGPQNASSVILGCMRMPALTAGEAEAVINTASAAKRTAGRVRDVRETDDLIRRISNTF